MKKSFLPIVSLVLAVVTTSCYNQIEELNSKTNNSDAQQITGETKAIHAFNDFINRLNSDALTRSTIPQAEIIAVKKTTTAVYDNKHLSRSNNVGLPVYELTLENSNMTQGFAVVADLATMDEVIAYSPIGSIADTAYNKGLALYFKDLAILSDITSKKVTARSDYWQPGWEEIYSPFGSSEFVRWLTQSEWENGPGHGLDWIYYDPVDKIEITNAYITTKWGQGNPYNNRVPKYANGTKNKVNVGCYAVAAGQIMTFHKYPSTYNWGILTISSTIPPTPLAIGGGIDMNKETTAQKEVSRLLTDIATAGETEYNTYQNLGSTFVRKFIPGLNKMGYSATDTYLGEKGGSATLIKDEIKNYQRPVLYYAQSDIGGHIWVVDAILTQERWEYTTFRRQEGLETKPGLERRRARGYLLHCNWGWGGNSDGWYYNFNPPHKDDFVKFYFGKHIYTGIKPQ